MLENYHMDDLGIIHQSSWTPKIYDQEYLAYYEGLQDRTIKLGYQRLGWALGIMGHLPDSLLEVGYGTGTFLEAAAIAGVPRCSGFDVARYPLPNRCTFIEWEQALDTEWELTALFDVLEHIPDLGFLEKLRTSYLAIAVPYCRWHDLGDEWFESWRMRLPDEHLHHFHPDGLIALMAQHGYNCEDLNTFEDGLRLRPGEEGPNILCGFFKSIR
jgi:hypothetical protein